MTDRLLDCRPHTRDSDTTSASAHPELLIGEFVMRPHTPPLLSSDDRVTISKWWRRMSGAVMALFVVVLIWPIVDRNRDGGVAANASERSSNPTCIGWDTTASTAVVTFVQRSQHDINLQQVSNMIDRMRRARRNCQLGLPNLACEDYRTIVREAASALESMPTSPFECGSVVAGEPDATSATTARR